MFKQRINDTQYSCFLPCDSFESRKHKYFFEFHERTAFFAPFVPFASSWFKIKIVPFRTFIVQYTDGLL